MTSTIASAIRHGIRDTRQQSGSPHTPSRYISSAQSSPGSSFFRTEEDPVIIELDPRGLRAGFQGESGPQCSISFTPQNSRRVGDYRTYLPDYKRRKEDIRSRSKDYELWRSDLKDVDLGLLEDKLERGVREAYSKHLLVDPGVARLILVLPSLVPHPVLSTILTLLFERWKYSSITLFPAPAMAIAAAGLRSGLIVDLGWEETVITAIYEYREVHVRRSTRGMRAFTWEMGALLDMVRKEQDESFRDSLLLDFNFVEEFIERAGASHALLSSPEEDLASDTETLKLEDEKGRSTPTGHSAEIMIDWPTDTSSRPVAIPRAKIQRVCLEALVGLKDEDHPDDHEQSVSQLLYRTLLSLSPDVRGICLSRVIFAGRGSTVADLPRTVLDTTTSIIQQYGWTGVRGQHIKSKRSGLAELAQGRAVHVDARHGMTRPGIDDFIEERLHKQTAKDAPPADAPVLRQVESLGAWAGASLIASLKARSSVEIEREKFLLHGLAGAHRDAEGAAVSQRTTSVKSGERTSWTLAGWA